MTSKKPPTFHYIVHYYPGAFTSTYTSFPGLVSTVWQKNKRGTVLEADLNLKLLSNLRDLPGRQTTVQRRFKPTTRAHRQCPRYGKRV